MYISSGIPRVTISGQVTAGGAGLPGVNIILSGGISNAMATTSDGDYAFSVIAGANYTITPVLPGYVFSPPSQALSAVNANQTVNFTLAGNPNSGGGPTDGNPDTPPIVYPNCVGTPPVPGPGSPNCMDLTGSWSDTTGGSWQMVQNVNLISGNLSVTTANCSANWTVSGQATSPGNYNLTATPQQGSCNRNSASINLSLTSCTSGSASYVFTQGGSTGFLGGGGSSNSATGVWTRLTPPITFSTTPSGSIAMSTGDTVQLKTTGSLPTAAVNVTYQLLQFVNLFSSLQR